MNTIVRENQLPKFPGAIVESIAFLYNGNIVFIPQILECFQPFLYRRMVSTSFVQQRNEPGVLQEVVSVVQSAVAGIGSVSCVIVREHCDRRMHLCSSLNTATLHSRPIYYVDLRRCSKWKLFAHFCRGKIIGSAKRKRIRHLECSL